MTIPPNLPKQYRRLAELADRAGWKITQSRRGNKHFRWRPPDRRKPIVVTASTPSDPRAYQNTVADLHRSGLPRDEQRSRKKAA